MPPVLHNKIFSLFIVFAFGIFTACTNSVAKEKSTLKTEATTTIKAIDSNKTTAQNTQAADSAESQYETYFVVIADTNMSYSPLQNEMYALSDTFKIAVDTMERYFNSKKNLIALPDDHADEVYAGDYFPRRFPSETLSLEYLDFYKRSSEKMIALVAGIYEEKKSADSALASIKSVAKQGFVVKSHMYVGCIH